MLGLSSSIAAPTDQTGTSTITMESCGAFLLEQGPVNYGSGHYFTILVGENTINRSDVILNGGYDYPCTSDHTVLHPWGEVPQLVNIGGIRSVPEDWAILPEGGQPTPRATLVTNNNILPIKERYIDVVNLPRNTNSRDLPTGIRKYLINVDGSDADAYDGTATIGWKEENDLWRYWRSNNTYISNTWLKLDNKRYYVNEQGIMLTDTITPDGYYANTEGEKTGYIPGWLQNGASWKYVRKNGYYTANQWIQDTDEKWYYFDMAVATLAGTTISDDYYVDASGVWDGQSASAVINGENPSPGVDTAAYTEE